MQASHERLPVARPGFTAAQGAVMTTAAQRTPPPGRGPQRRDRGGEGWTFLSKTWGAKNLTFSNGSHGEKVKTFSVWKVSSRVFLNHPSTPSLQLRLEGGVKERTGEPSGSSCRKVPSVGHAEPAPVQCWGGVSGSLGARQHAPFLPGSWAGCWRADRAHVLC